jgi:hypothetical protein
MAREEERHDLPDPGGGRQRRQRGAGRAAVPGLGVDDWTRPRPRHRHRHRHQHRCLSRRANQAAVPSEYQIQARQATRRLGARIGCVSSEHREESSRK